MLKTQLNHLLALQKLFAWIEFLLDARQRWKSLYERRNIKTLLRERQEWLEKQIKVIKPAATRETMERNDRIALEEVGKWVDLTELIQVCLFVFASLLCCINEYNSVSQAEKEIRSAADDALVRIESAAQPTKADLDLYRNCCIFSFTILKGCLPLFFLSYPTVI